jgi:hypothetical protein
MHRGWLLTLLATLAGIALGIAALLLDGDLRASLAAGSIVCLVAAAVCTGIVMAETSDSAPVDFLEAGPPEPPAPHDQVMLVYDTSGVKHCSACGRPRPASEDFCPYCTAPPAPTPRRSRGESQAIDTGLETRWGGGPENPTLEELRAALEELNTVDEEHPSAWLTDSDGWTVDVYEGGLVIVSEKDETICERRGVTREQALELWLLLQQGKRDEIIRRMKL